jgi:hypothetical protein
MAIANLNEFLRNCEFGRSNSLAGMEEPAVSDYKRVMDPGSSTSCDYCLSHMIPTRSSGPRAASLEFAAQ